jgi:putative flippase GtrA
MTARTGANSCVQNAVRGIRIRERDATLRQADDGERVAPMAAPRSVQETHAAAGESFANSNHGNEMQASGVGVANSFSRKVLAVNSLREFAQPAVREKATEEREKCKRSVRATTLVRWCKFNLVGAIGILVQFAALFFLKSVVHFNYLAATALAVEAAVVHNFVWHERYTWADRVANPSGAEAQNPLTRLIAALKRCATQNLRGLQALIATQNPRATQRPLPMLNFCWPSWRRFLRFNFTIGLVSIAGNLGVMRVMVGLGHMNYLVANGLAIVLCSLANFLVSEVWVFD